jgi:hypothetical protein
MKRILVAAFCLLPLRLLAGPGTSNNFVLPVASAAGQFGTYFRTDVSLVNPYPWKPVTVRLQFLQTNTTNSSPQVRDVTLAAGSSSLLPDVLQGTFGLTGTSGAIIASTVGTDSAFFLASARTYTGSAGGSYGLSSEGISDFNGPGTDALLSGIRNGGGFRTNTVVVSTTPTPLSFRLDAWSSNGTLVGSIPVSLPPYGHTQISVSGFAAAFDSGYLTWTCLTTSGNVAWAAYATPIDNTSGDSSFILDRRDDAFALHHNIYNLTGTWSAAVTLGGSPQTLLARVYQTGPLVRTLLYIQATGEQLLEFRGYEDQGVVTVTGTSLNFSCIGATATSQLSGSATQVSGTIGGTGCFASGGTATFTKQSSSTGP